LDRLDDVVDVVERGQSALQNVGAIFGLVKLELRAPPDDIAAVFEIVVDHLTECEHLWRPVDQREIDHAKCSFEVTFEQLVFDDVDHRIPLEFDDDTHSIAVGLVAEIADAL